MEEIKYDDIPYFDLNGYKTEIKVLKIYDGDTFIACMNYMNGYFKFKMRINGIDAPEIKTQNKIESKAGKIVRNLLVKLLTNIEIENDNECTYNQLNELLKNNTKIINVECGLFDKYGRLLVDVYVNGENVKDKLLNEYECVKNYTGKTKEQFTENELNNIISRMI